MRESERQARGVEGFVCSERSKSEIYGVQWGDPESTPWLQRVLNEFLLSQLRVEMTALEIGSGGGRWSRYFAGRVTRACLVDATVASEIAIRSHCDWPGFGFIVSPDGALPALQSESIDFAFSFDTFVHFDPALFDRYIVELGRVLKPSAKFILHYARRWPECEQDDTIFFYREKEDVKRLLAEFGFGLTGRELELRGGFGSIVVEAVKAT